ncbi:MAG: SDR family NAD(P)-dependent oxidoreductase [Oscillospiraceae bacterium]|nr:SDR family NAD(P)-dependent oxidoreductase [Oscillospiraceae bacterium]
MKKTVLVTGSSRGIGADTARLFASKGYNTIINYNKSEIEVTKLLSDLKAKTKASILCLKADVSKSYEVEHMVKKINKFFGSIDILVNNAGVALYKQIQDTTEKDFDYVLNTNLKGVFNCTKAVVSNMIRKKSGVIINVSSLWGKVGASCEVIYSASKAGIIGFSKALRKELAPSFIRVECITPGVVITDMNKKFSINELHKISKILKPKDIAKIIFKLATDKVVTNNSNRFPTELSSFLHKIP